MTDETEELLADLRSRGATIETEALRRELDDRGVLWVADDSGHTLRTYFCDWEYDEDLYGKAGVYSDRTELSTVCLTAEEAVEVALNVWDENEKLRKKLEFEREDNASMRALFDAVAPRCGKPDCPSLVEYVEQLRELVRIMVYCMQYERGCDGCRLNGADGAITDPAGCDGMFDRMRELGIEVGE